MAKVKTLLREKKKEAAKNELRRITPYKEMDVGQIKTNEGWLYKINSQIEILERLKQDYEKRIYKKSPTEVDTSSGGRRTIRKSRKTKTKKSSKKSRKVRSKSKKLRKTKSQKSRRMKRSIVAN